MFYENYSKIEELENEQVEKLFLDVFEKGVKLCSYGYIAAITDFPVLILIVH